MSAREEPSVFRPDSVSYLHLPAPDPDEAASFYAAVFSWQVRHSDPGGHPAFTDGSGHVIGHWVDNRKVVGPGAGAIPYIYVDDVAATLARVVSNGGALATEPYPEGTLTVATFTDPGGNEIGVWQRA